MRLQRSSGEKMETRMAVITLISRVVGVHRLILLNFYPFLQRYLQPHQRNVTTLLAALIQVSSLHSSLCTAEGLGILQPAPSLQGRAGQGSPVTFLPSSTGCGHCQAGLLCAQLKRPCLAHCAVA